MNLSLKEIYLSYDKLNLSFKGIYSSYDKMNLSKRKRLIYLTFVKYERSRPPTFRSALLPKRILLPLGYFFLPVKPIGQLMIMLLLSLLLSHSTNNHNLFGS